MFDAYGAAAVASSAALWGSSLVGATLSLISTTRDKRPAPRRRPTSDPPFADIESHADRIPSSEEYGHAGFFGALHRVWSVILHVVLMLFAAIALADVMSSLRDEARSAAIPDAGPESVHRYDLATGYCGAYRLLGEQSSNTGLFTADNFDGCSTLQRIVLSAFDSTHHVSHRQHTHRMIQRETDSLPLFSVRMVLQKDLPSRVETPVTDMMALAPVRQEQPQAEVPDINPPAEVPNTLPPVVEQTTQAATEAPTGTESEPAAGSANENDDNGGTSSNGDAASNGSGSSRQDSGPRFLKPTRDECAPALERSLIILMLEMIIEIVLVIAGAILMSAKEIRRQFRRWKVILLLLYLVPVLFFNVGIFWFGGAPTGSCLTYFPEARLVFTTLILYAVFKITQVVVAIASSKQCAQCCGDAPNEDCKTRRASSNQNVSFMGESRKVRRDEVINGPPSTEYVYDTVYETERPPKFAIDLFGCLRAQR